MTRAEAAPHPKLAAQNPSPQQLTVDVRSGQIIITGNLNNIGSCSVTYDGPNQYTHELRRRQQLYAMFDQTGKKLPQLGTSPDSRMLLYRNFIVPENNPRKDKIDNWHFDNCNRNIPERAPKCSNELLHVVAC